MKVHKGRSILSHWPVGLERKVKNKELFYLIRFSKTRVENAFLGSKDIFWNDLCISIASNVFARISKHLIVWNVTHSLQIEEHASIYLGQRIRTQSLDLLPVAAEKDSLLTGGMECQEQQPHGQCLQNGPHGVCAAATLSDKHIIGTRQYTKFLIEKLLCQLGFICPPL